MRACTVSRLCVCMCIRKYLIFTIVLNWYYREYIRIYRFFRVKKFFENFFVNFPYSYRFETDKIQKLILLIQIRSNKARITGRARQIRVEKRRPFSRRRGAFSRVGGDPHAKHLGHRLNRQVGGITLRATFKNSEGDESSGEIGLNECRVIIIREKLLIDRKTFQYAFPPPLTKLSTYTLLLHSFTLSLLSPRGFIYFYFWKRRFGLRMNI